MAFLESPFVASVVDNITNSSLWFYLSDHTLYLSGRSLDHFLESCSPCFQCCFEEKSISGHWEVHSTFLTFKKIYHIAWFITIFVFFFPFVPVFLLPGAYVRGSLFKEFLLLLFLSAFQNSGNRILQNIKDLLVQQEQLIGLVCLIIVEVKSVLPLKKMH